jgi:subtilisin family serine protease
VLLIAAAGNSGNTAISYPAGFAEVVSVAAVDDLKVKASFSQFNADVEIAGPGVNTLSTLPVGKGTSATLSVAATPYTVLGMVGSPNASATGPLADFGLGDTPAPGSMAGKVCLIQRGNISFSDKVLNCQSSGGLGAVIYNNVPGELAGTLNGVVTTIPSVGATDVAGAAMLGQLGQSATVAVSTSDYGALSGTSMATPHVAAVAALVWSYFPNCTAAQIRTSLNNSAEDLGTPGRDTSYGFGLVRAKSAFDRITALGCGV